MTTATQPFTIRQSTLATFVRCPLSARYSLEVDSAGDFHNPPQARGVMAHRCQAEILRRMKAQGERRIGIGAALAVAEEVMGQVGMPLEERLVLGPEQKNEVRQAVVGFAKHWAWDVKRIIAIERRLYSTIRGPDGVDRVLTGQPDVILAMPPQGAEIEDSKTGWGPPKQPREDVVTDERRYLSERGNYQLNAYAVLVMDNYPAIQRVRLTERHLMVGEERAATLERDELEEVKRRLGEDLMLLDEALHAEPPEGAGEAWGGWQPIGGRWCSWCSGKTRCPRPLEDRGEGAVLDLPMASEYGQDLAKVEAQREHIIEAAKAWVDANGPIPMPDGQVLGWDMPPPEDAAEAPDAPRGICKWCGEPIQKEGATVLGQLDRRRQYHGKEGEPNCKEQWDAAGGARRFRLHVPSETNGASPKADAPSEGMEG